MATQRSSNQPPVITVWFFVIFMAAPYLTGLYFSSKNLDMMRNLLDSWLIKFQPKSTQPTGGSTQRQLQNVDECYERVLVNMFRGLHAKRRDDPFEGVSIVMHRNGEAVACGESTDILAALKETLRSMDRCPSGLDNKYRAEALMTRLFHHLFSDQCPSMERHRSPDLGFYGYCDMGSERTPILTDHKDLVPIQHQHGGHNMTFLPCHFHSYNGVRITSLPQLADLARGADEKSCSNSQDETCSVARRQLHIYAVPAGRMFMFAPIHVGEIISLPHVVGADPTKPVYLEVLSLSPRVFDLFNFFSRSESADLVDRAIKETQESHRIKRSTTGAVGHNVNQHRTSESGFDTTGETSVALKKRCFDVLGFDKYIESHADGLQILRYNLSTAYNSHMDWIEGNDQLEHDYDSARLGGNRFATILLYMSDLGEKDGGETVFTEAWPPGQTESDHVEMEEALRHLRESGDAHLLKEGSWEEKLVAKCRSRLAVRPHSGRAVLFYSQLPNGEEDRSSLHGACPVLSGTKYAANLWVWNTPRQGYPNNPKNPKYKGESQTMKGITATFTNSGADPALENAELFFENKFWGKLGKNDPPISVNTYRSHVWRLVVDGTEIRRWTIETDEGTRAFVV